MLKFDEICIIFRALRLNMTIALPAQSAASSQRRPISINGKNISKKEGRLPTLFHAFSFVVCQQFVRIPVQITAAGPEYGYGIFFAPVLRAKVRKPCPYCRIILFGVGHPHLDNPQMLLHIHLQTPVTTRSFCPDSALPDKTFPTLSLLSVTGRPREFSTFF